MKKVSLFLADGFEEIEAVATMDVLRRAGIAVETVSITGMSPVTGAHGIVVNADTLFEAAIFDDSDMLVLPGGMPGTLNLQNHSGLKDVLINFDNKRKFIAAICAAPLILGELGMLEGREATVYKGYEEHLLGADYDASSLKLDGHILTAAGPYWTINFALSIVAILLGKNKAELLCYEMQGT
ncbi:MAG: DJ-1/PfpI family protein [Bacteroidales bacterium]|jgi:4-methyl-5(b-hydroxyethyl)-thiazole monophosphate biosynthesis|nr:DJ-1/PfpI family protein [Bacteroidales bacterium]